MSNFLETRLTQKTETTKGISKNKYNAKDIKIDTNTIINLKNEMSYPQVDYIITYFLK